MVIVAFTRAERQKAADLIHRLLELVDEGHLAADGPAGVALVRRMVGAMLALTALAGHTVHSRSDQQPIDCGGRSRGSMPTRLTRATSTPIVTPDDLAEMSSISLSS
jgi:hypothetical protein